MLVFIASLFVVALVIAHMTARPTATCTHTHTHTHMNDVLPGVALDVHTYTGTGVISPVSFFTSAPVAELLATEDDNPHEWAPYCEHDPNLTNSSVRPWDACPLCDDECPCGCVSGCGTEFLAEPTRTDVYDAIGALGAWAERTTARFDGYELPSWAQAILDEEAAKPAYKRLREARVLSGLTTRGTLPQPVCAGTTKAGNACKKLARVGHTTCAFHTSAL